MAPFRQITVVDALHQLLQSLSFRSDLLATLRLIMDLSVRLSGGDRASIFLLDRGRSEIWSMLSDGDHMIRLPLNTGIVGEVLSTNTPVTVRDATQDARFHPGVDRYTGYVTRTILCVPMRDREGRASGAIEVLNKRRGVFGQKDQRLLEILGIQAGLAIESVAMYDQIAESCRQRELVLETQKKINDSMDTEEIFGVILQDVVSATGGVSGVIHSVSESGRESFYGYHPGHGLRFWESDDRRTWPEYLHFLREQLFQTTDEEDGFRERENVLSSALRKGDRQFGRIAVLLSGASKPQFGSQTHEYLKIIAEQTVSIIDKKNALELRQRTEKQAALGSMLSQVLHDMKSPLSGVSGFVQLIQRRTADDKVKEFCSIIVQTLGRLERMNAELLLFVRGDLISLDKTDFSISELFRDICSLFHEKSQLQGINLQVYDDERLTLLCDF